MTLNTPSNESINAWKQLAVTKYFFRKIAWEIQLLEQALGNGQPNDYAEYTAMAGKIQSLKSVMSSGIMETQQE